MLRIHDFRREYAPHEAALILQSSALCWVAFKVSVVVEAAAGDLLFAFIRINRDEPALPEP
jgi:hypothetical protein